MTIGEMLSLFRAHGYPTLANEIEIVLPRISGKEIEKKWKLTDKPDSTPISLPMVGTILLGMQILSFFMLAWLCFK